MPQPDETESPSMKAEAYFRKLDADVTAAMKEQGFPATLRWLKKGRIPRSSMMTVEGVVEKLPSGHYDAALQTEEGPLLLRNVQRSDRGSIDPQLIPSNASQSFGATTDSDELTLTADHLLRQLIDAVPNPSSSLICTVELTRFDPSERQALLPLLWQYILDHRNSNNRDELIAVGAAVRKYIAIMPIDRMGELAILLESGHKSPLSIELEIEVAKMIYRNFEAHPPAFADPQPELAQRLWEMVQAYINPRILLRDKHSAATSLAIEAIVSMWSPLAEQAMHAAVACPYHWFAELVSDDLNDLHETWSGKNPDAASWLAELRNNVFAHV